MLCENIPELDLLLLIEHKYLQWIHIAWHFVNLLYDDVFAELTGLQFPEP